MFFSYNLISRPNVTSHYRTLTKFTKQLQETLSGLHRGVNQGLIVSHSSIFHKHDAKATEHQCFLHSSIVSENTVLPQSKQQSTTENLCGIKLY